MKVVCGRFVYAAFTP
ncbi:hypothetical protein OC512_21485 [Vibrio vulnificus]|nr:hypothetical protein [Vibrio vulnificus]MCU8404462.1 hypothetical protein [Vibrio vulnificus]